MATVSLMQYSEVGMIYRGSNVHLLNLAGSQSL